MACCCALFLYFWVLQIVMIPMDLSSPHHSTLIHSLDFEVQFCSLPKRTLYVSTLSPVDRLLLSRILFELGEPDACRLKGVKLVVIHDLTNNTKERTCWFLANFVFVKSLSSCLPSLALLGP